ncbi:CGNR zinc finger domain-containing protein [Kordiimonas aestuarii]|uniref:CGNR zinc finger domain-containing protein n=1 Tax=Kordiimonas aestuarii TaxID=1005925 RepID=UPI0021D13EDC|nr:ABATE domain-containing protein [Kordiimonas aestuarii]
MAKDLSETGETAIVHEFGEGDLIGGHPVLDFINTLIRWGSPEPLDRLDGYISLAQWSVVAGVMEPALADIVAMKASLEPDDAVVALENARALRGILHHVLAAHAQGGEPAYDDMEAFEAFWKQAIGAHRLAFTDDHIEIRPVAFTSLTIIADLITRDAVDLVKTLPDRRLRLCANDACGWLYLVKSARAKQRYCGGRVCLNKR